MHRKLKLAVFIALFVLFTGILYGVVQDQELLERNIDFLHERINNMYLKIDDLQLQLDSLQQQQDELLRYKDLSDLTSLPIDIVSYAFAVANEYEFAPELLLGLIHTESEGNPNSTGNNKNGTKDRGLGQLNDGTSPWLWAQVFDVPFRQELLYDPYINITLTAWYLNYLWKLNDGDLHKTLTAYNRGQRGMSLLSTPETAYSKKVLNKYAFLSQ